ncbi:hypothetical protein MSKU3_0468 [Komagataeibacter oboediens]|nr:hypothetical protein MSKU3_0468 [Komagataeibacter oboediens]
MYLNVQIFEYYIFERDGNFLAIQNTYNGLFFDAHVVFNFLIQQKFSFYDADFHRFPQAIYAYNPNDVKGKFYKLSRLFSMHGDFESVYMLKIIIFY